MPVIPKWFDKELKMIDPLYFAEWNEENAYWEIKRKMTEHMLLKGSGVEIKIHNPTVAVFKRLDDSALENIRERKWLSRRYPGKAYTAFIISQAREAKEKKKQLALEMATEGMMKILNWDKKKTFDMATVTKGGKNDESGDHSSDPGPDKRTVN